jgi:hypothetical protein
MSDRIVVRYFGGGVWDRFARMMRRAAAEHCPGWALDLVEMPAVTTVYSPLGYQGAVHNTRKLDAWRDAVEGSADGDRVLLLDADAVILRPLDDVWLEPFDLAYTVKPKGSRLPFNGGVVFLTVSDRTKAFVRTWAAANRFFLENPKEYQVWAPAFGGINQSALGMLLSSNAAARPEPFRDYQHGLNIKRLPCAEWNVEDEHWERADLELARIVHYKGNLQRVLTGKVPDGRVTRPLVALFRHLEGRSERAMRKPEHDRMVRPEDLTIPEDSRGVEIPEEADVSVPEPVAVADVPPARLTRAQRRAAARKGASG